MSQHVFQPSSYSYGDASPYTTAALRTDLMAPAEVESEVEASDTLVTALAVGGTAGLIGLAVGIVILPTFVLYPWAIKQFKPEWSYSKRLVGGVATSTALGLAYKAVDSGKSKD